MRVRLGLRGGHAPGSLGSRTKRLHRVGSALVAAVFLVAIMGVGAGCNRLERLRKGHRPTVLYAIPVAAMTGPERVLIATLQGILALDSDEQIYIHPEAGGYETWLEDLVLNYGVTRVDVVDAWWLVDHFADKISGYLLYETGNDSVNAATSLAGLERAVVVEISIEAQAIAHGLTRVLDLRARDEAWVLANHGMRLNWLTAVEQKESFEHSLRDYAVMSRALVFYDGNSSFRESVMDWLLEDSVLLGWGDPSLGEDVFIRSGSESGVFTLPADHAHNLSPLSGFPVIQQAQKPRPQIIADPDVHYVSFLMTDGDNVQWALGTLQSDTRWFGSPLRGDFDMGWGFPPSLVRLAPSVMHWYYDNAASGTGRDAFVAGPSGGGYLYPSLFPRADLEDHVAELAEWMALADLSVVEILDFDSFTDTDLWDVYTARPEIEGLIYLEYGDHSQPAGKLVWSNAKPVLSPGIKLWQGLANSDPASILSRVNGAPRDPTSPLGYTLVIVGVWSHSLADIQGIIDGLAADVRVVAPDTLLELVSENVPHSVAIDHDYTRLDAEFGTEQLALVGSAFWASDHDALFAPHPDRLRLTSNGGGQVGSAWWQGQVDPSQSWATTFRFQITYPAGGGADGLAFHVHAHGPGANPGHQAGGLSAPALSVIIDTWDNGPEGTSESLGVVLDGTQLYLNDLLDFAGDPNPGSSPNVFRLELAYSAGTHELSLRLFDENGSAALYDSLLGLDLDHFGPSTLGFSAATGGSAENHDIRTWSFHGAAMP
ncbi:MAG: GxGYxYP family putative glycoside hydrolase [Myxococcota bacterium]|jgi:hypothetical protein|nr:GxGYxYP family putative glycoside hydrolase [Myxococcota bacterium]